MKTYLEERINEIKSKYSKRQLRRMFYSRKHDDLFDEIGILSGGREVMLGGHFLTWKGFELLTDSMYLK